MKQIFTICLLLAGLVVKAQTLEHEYSTWVGYAKVNSNEGVYYSYNQKLRIISIYNMNHSLIKSITANVSDTTLSCNNLSKVLINTNPTDFEFILSGGRSSYIIGDNGSILTTFSGKSNTLISSVYPINTINGAKLIVSYYDTPYYNPRYLIYSLIGTFAGKKELTEDQTDLLPYPNPTQQLITLQLENKTTSLVQVSIYNITGQQVDNLLTQGNVLYDASKLSTGEYYYTENGKYSGKFVKQ